MQPQEDLAPTFLDELIGRPGALPGRHRGDAEKLRFGSFLSQHALIQWAFHIARTDCAPLAATGFISFTTSNRNPDQPIPRPAPELRAIHKYVDPSYERALRK